MRDNNDDDINKNIYSLFGDYIFVFVYCRRLAGTHYDDNAEEEASHRRRQWVPRFVRDVVGHCSKFKLKLTQREKFSFHLNAVLYFVALSSVRRKLFGPFFPTFFDHSRRKSHKILSTKIISFIRHTRYSSISVNTKFSYDFAKRTRILYGVLSGNVRLRTFVDRSNKYAF